MTQDSGMPADFFDGMNPGWAEEYRKHIAAHPTPPLSMKSWEHAYRTLAMAFDDMPDTCDDGCDSWGHSDACTNKGQLWPAEEIVRLRGLLAQYQKTP